jgi:hypothetical protein
MKVELIQLADVQMVVRDPGGEHLARRHRANVRMVMRLWVLLTV